MLDVRILGEVPYEEAQALMKELQQQRIEGAVPDTLLILSHPEVVSVGPSRPQRRNTTSGRLHDRGR